MFNANPGESCTATAAPSCSLWKTWRKNLLLFCSASVYIELCLHLCVYRSLDRYAVYLFLFGLLGGVLSSLLVSCLPGVARQIAGFLLIAAQVLFAEVQLVYQVIFGNFMPINEISMGGNVVTNFASQILYSIGRNLSTILLLLIPLPVMLLCLALRKPGALKRRLRWQQALASAGVFLGLLVITASLMLSGRNKPLSVYHTFCNVNTSTDSSYKKVGMLATTAQELRYMLFGSRSGTSSITPSSLGASSSPRTYSSNSYNVIESIDFAALASGTNDEALKNTDQYLATVIPTRKNNYTGLLKDYNLITICAESFCPWFISEELTPTLYTCTRAQLVTLLYRLESQTTDMVNYSGDVTGWMYAPESKDTLVNLLVSIDTVAHGSAGGSLQQANAAVSLVNLAMNESGKVEEAAKTYLAGMNATQKDFFSFQWQQALRQANVLLDGSEDPAILDDAGDAGFDLKAVSSAKVDALDKTVIKLLRDAGVTDEWKNHTDLEPFSAA